MLVALLLLSRTDFSNIPLVLKYVCPTNISKSDKDKYAYKLPSTVAQFLSELLARTKIFLKTTYDKSHHEIIKYIINLVFLC